MDETQPMKGLRSDIFLHVSIIPVETTKLRISSKFISQHKQSAFLDDYVDSRDHPCHMKGNLETTRSGVILASYTRIRSGFNSTSLL